MSVEVAQLMHDRPIAVVEDYSSTKQILNSSDLEKYRLKNAPPTMYYIPDFLSKAEETELIRNIESTPSKWYVNECYKMDWGRVHHPDGRVFRDGGDMPDWAEQTIERITPVERLFSAGTEDHFLHINKYIPGQGIDPHRDFQNGPMTASVTLNSPGLLDFYYPSSQKATSSFEEVYEDRQRRYIGSVWLEPRSLFIFTDVAFNVLWHGLQKVKTDTIPANVFNLPADVRVGSKLERGVRYSVGNYSTH